MAAARFASRSLVICVDTAVLGSAAVAREGCSSREMEMQQVAQFTAKQQLLAATFGSDAIEVSSA